MIIICPQKVYISDEIARELGIVNLGRVKLVTEDEIKVSTINGDRCAAYGDLPIKQKPAIQLRVAPAPWRTAGKILI